MKAFPIPKDVLGLDYCGMNLRDYFAAKAMQGFFSIYGNIKVDKGNTKVKFIAENSYVLADAMMEARNEKS